jgi:hypothetical protein
VILPQITVEGLLYAELGHAAALMTSPTPCEKARGSGAWMRAGAPTKPHPPRGSQIIGLGFPADSAEAEADVG